MRDPLPLQARLPMQPKQLWLLPEMEQILHAIIPVAWLDHDAMACAAGRLFGDEVTESEKKRHSQLFPLLDSFKARHIPATQGMFWLKHLKSMSRKVFRQICLWCEVCGLLWFVRCLFDELQPRRRETHGS